LTRTSPSAPARLRRSRKKKFEAEVERAVRTAVAAVEGDTAIILEAQAAKQAEKKKRHPHRQLARSIGDLQDIVRTVKARGASLKATEQPIDPASSICRSLPRHPRPAALQRPGGQAWQWRRGTRGAPGGRTGPSGGCVSYAPSSGYIAASR
jgi:hypothetical protein